MKHISILTVLILAVVFGVEAKLPPSRLQTTNLDYFVLSAINPSAKESRVSLITRDDGLQSDAYLEGYDGLQFSADPSLGIYGSAIDSHGGWNLLIKDVRSYGGRLYVEFPLVFYANVPGDYTLLIREAGLQQSRTNVSAVFIQLIDSISPGDIRYHTLWQMEGKKAASYSFTLSSAASDSRRFKVRFYEANVLKTDVPYSWDAPGAWEGGFVPGTRSQDDGLQVIIPAGGVASIPADSDVTIGSLFNWGKVTVENGARLTTTEQCELNTKTENFKKK